MLSFLQNSNLLQPLISW